MKMKIYESQESTIVNWQWSEPGLRNITDIVMSPVAGKNGRVLDAGCGTGRVSIELARRGFEVDGLDTDPRVIAIAKTMAAQSDANCHFFIGDITVRGDVPRTQYDMVICSEVIEHIEDYKKAIEVFHDILVPNGTLILTTPHDPSQFSVLDVEAGHYRRYTIDQLKQDLSAFTIDFLTTSGFPFYRSARWLYPQLLRLRGRQYSREELWGTGRLSLTARLLYSLTKVDNLFNSLHLGDCVIIRARPLRMSRSGASSRKSAN